MAISFGGSVAGYRPALAAAYDYYPFGMLMPGRYVQDTSAKCMTLSANKWMARMVGECYGQSDWPWPGLKLRGAYTDFYGTDIIMTGNGGYVEFKFNVEPGRYYRLTLDISQLYYGQIWTSILERIGGGWSTISNEVIGGSGRHELFFYSTAEEVAVRLEGDFDIDMHELCLEYEDYGLHSVLVDVCDDKGDNYMFGYNGQEKVNEIAGIGNHTTAEFGEFDTRLGRRWNVDPKLNLMPNESPYAVNHGNPIVYKDPKGDFGFIGAAIGAVAGAVIEYGSQAASNIIQGKSLKDALWNEIDFADVGVSAAEGALAGTTGGASLIITRVTAGAVRASVDYTPEKKWKYIGGKNEKEKKLNDVLLDAGSEVVGGLVGKGFDKAGSKEFIRKAPRSLFKGGAKKAMQALEDEVIMGTVESGIPTIIDGAVKGRVEADVPIPLGYEDPDTKKFVPYNIPSQIQEK